MKLVRIIPMMLQLLELFYEHINYTMKFLKALFARIFRTGSKRLRRPFKRWEIDKEYDSWIGI